MVLPRRSPGTLSPREAGGAPWEPDTQGEIVLYCLVRAEEALQEEVGAGTGFGGVGRNLLGGGVMTPFPVKSSLR